MLPSPFASAALLLVVLTDAPAWRVAAALVLAVCLAFIRRAD
jgi:hypothetical protein